jgi:dipeptidyl aminopeptidase/acylaminoacyl peptidase
LSRVAFVGLDRQIYVTDTALTEPVPLTAPVPRAGGAWGVSPRSQETWSWPTWSPDDAWIAGFAVEGSDTETGPARVVALSLDGVRQVEWAHIPNVSPIYLQWHPTGDALSILLQQGTDLTLSLVRKERIGQVRPLEQGVPLFFNWSPDGARVLIHVGGKDDPNGRLVLRDPLGDDEDILYDRSPGSFCAPVFPAGRAVMALRADDGSSEVVVSDMDGGNPTTLLARRGLLAVVPAPNGAPWVAVSAAPRGEGSPYQGIELVHIETGETRTLSVSDCLAFFWSPKGDYLLYAVVDSEANCLLWNMVYVEGGPSIPLGSFWPTRDILFYLHFFDQYAQSHPIISHDGRHVVFAGYPAGGGQADLSSPPRIFLKDVTDPDRPPELLGRGSFAVFANKA